MATSVPTAPTAGSPETSRTLVSALAALVGLGALAFLLGIAGGAERRTWAIFLVNLVFWSGLAATGPAVAGMIALTEGRWGGRLRRIAITTAPFMPVSFGPSLVRLARRP